MSYTTDCADLVANQLERFMHLHTYQLAGQIANYDFWLDEAVHALRMIDDYPRRFGRLRDFQREWVKMHAIKVSDYCPQCGGACEFGPQTPAAPRRVPAEELNAARANVRHSAYRLMLRCHSLGLLDEATVREACDRLGVHIEAEDLAPSPFGATSGDPTGIGPIGGDESMQSPRIRARKKRR